MQPFQARAAAEEALCRQLACCCWIVTWQRAVFDMPRVPDARMRYHDWQLHSPDHTPHVSFMNACDEGHCSGRVCRQALSYLLYVRALVCILRLAAARLGHVACRSCFCIHDIVAVGLYNPQGRALGHSFAFKLHTIIVLSVLWVNRRCRLLWRLPSQAIRIIK